MVRGRLPHRRHRLHRVQSENGRPFDRVDRADSRTPLRLRKASRQRARSDRRRFQARPHRRSRYNAARARSRLRLAKKVRRNSSDFDSSARRAQLALKTMATPYKINIPMYEGPLDLLLDLIKQQKMSIHDIQISLITSQYLDYLHKLEELNVDVSSEFIYMAASLIYIKSKMLLPPDPLASPEEQAA